MTEAEVRLWFPWWAGEEERRLLGVAGAGDPWRGPALVVTGLEPEERAALARAGVLVAEGPLGAVLQGSREALADASGGLRPALREQVGRCLAALDPPPPRTLVCRDRTLRLGRRVLVMGIVNVTPDSFSDGGRYLDPEHAVAHARELVQAGADILDVGGESTRPGYTPVPAEEELRRVLPVVEGVLSLGVPVSVDTMKAAVARACLERGAHIVNDVWGLSRDPDMARTVAEAGAGVVIMHNQEGTGYRTLLGDVHGFLAAMVRRGEEAGISREQMMVDPGIGFGKTAAQSLEVLRRLPELKGLGLPILVGPSRKSFIGRHVPLPLREEGTAAAVALAVAGGAQVVRVHDVARMARVVRMAERVLFGPEEE